MSNEKTIPNVSAFPNSYIGCNDGLPYHDSGLTKREYFAALSLQGLLANSHDNGHNQPASVCTPHQLAEHAVRCADALIDMLNGKEVPPIEPSNRLDFLES